MAKRHFLNQNQIIPTGYLEVTHILDMNLYTPYLSKVIS